MVQDEERPEVAGQEEPKAEDKEEDRPSDTGEKGEGIKEEEKKEEPPVEIMTVEEIADKLRELTFEVKDKTIDLPMGDTVAVVKAFAPLLQSYCDIVPKVASKVQEYFGKNQVPIEMIKAVDIYFYELKRAMRKYPEVEEDENLKNAIDMVVTPYEKVITTMVNVARDYAKKRGHDYDTDY